MSHIEKIKVNVEGYNGSADFQITIPMGHGPADLLLPHGQNGATRRIRVQHSEKMFIYQTNFSKSFRFPGIMGKYIHVSLKNETAHNCKLIVYNCRSEVVGFLLMDMEVSFIALDQDTRTFKTRLVNVNTNQKTQTFEIDNFVTTEIINILEGNGANEADFIQVQYNQQRTEKTVNLTLRLEFALNPSYMIYYKDNFLNDKKVQQSSGQIKTLADLEVELKLMTLGTLMEQNKEYSDFKIVVGENPSAQVTFDVHKLVLASQSEYFAGLFRSDCEEMKNGCLHLKDDVNVEKFSVILKFLYHGSFKGCNVNSKDFGEYYRLADRFGIKNMELYCKITILYDNDFDGKFAFELLELAFSIGTESFQDSILELIKPLYPEIKKLEKWGQFIDSPENKKVIKKLLFILE